MRVGPGLSPCARPGFWPLLERLTLPIPELAAEYWIVVHRDMRRAACVRAVMDWLRQVFAKQRDLIAGATPSARLAMPGPPCKLPGQHENRGCGVNMIRRSDGG
ncbi:MAG: hypothetical protein ABSC95_20115 [Acetobacteraceae bacterium]|jgi:hypothetical protein